MDSWFEKISCDFFMELNEHVPSNPVTADDFNIVLLVDGIQSISQNPLIGQNIVCLTPRRNKVDYGKK